MLIKNLIHFEISEMYNFEYVTNKSEYVLVVGRMLNGLDGTDR